MAVGDDKTVQELIRLAKGEDLGSGDITSQLLSDPSQEAKFELVVREPCVFCGREVAEQIVHAYDAVIHVVWAEDVQDGSQMRVGANIAAVRGPLGSILAAERVLLNFVQRLCGVATRTRKFVDAIAGTHAKIYDTRKTTPGWRALEKYAVRCGGGENHRAGLHDAILIKDNHLFGVPQSRLGAVVFNMLNRVPVTRDGARVDVEIEASSLEQVEGLFDVIGIDIILLDNFSLGEIQSAVQFRERRGLAARVQFEVSGGVKLQTVRAIAETGVERISVGSITHSATAIDLALERV